MPRTAAIRNRSRPRGTSRDADTELAAAQVTEAFRRLAANGVITGHAEKISARIDHGLLAAAARKLGSDNTTQVLQAALAAFVAADPFVTWLLSDQDLLPADFELAV